MRRGGGGIIITGAEKHTELKCQAPEDGPPSDRALNKTQKKKSNSLSCRDTERKIKQTAAECRIIL